MVTSRFQLGLIATLAVGLGFSLSSSEAVGYPEAAVSLGANPVWSVGGTLGEDIVTVLTAPSDQAAIMTDVALTATGHAGSYPCTTTVTLLDDDATISAAYQLASYTRSSSGSWAPTSVVQSLSSGIAVAPGDTLRISVASTCTSSFAAAYTLSGYYAQP
jgi:hypothetical protein